MAAAVNSSVLSQEEEDAWAEAWGEVEMEDDEREDSHQEDHASEDGHQEDHASEDGHQEDHAECLLLQLPQEIVCRVLSFLSHASLVNAVFRVNVRLSQSSAAEARSRTQIRLLDALVAGFGKGADRPRLHTLATQLEKALARAGSLKYQHKLRQLVFNLKDPKNPNLRARLLAGDLGAADLLRLTSDQLAGSELQQQRSEWRRKGKLRAMRPQCSSGYETDLYRCDNCGESKTKVHRTIRAGRTHVDRATTWASCVGCRHRWEV